MGIFDNVVKNLKDQLETNVSNVMAKGLEKLGVALPPQASASKAVNSFFFPQCGSRVEAGGNFCTSCGTAVANRSVPDAASLSPALAEYQQFTIFDFKLAEKKEKIRTGKFVVEGLFYSRKDTTVIFVDPEDLETTINFTLNQRPPQLGQGQKATVYFHCEGYFERFIDELVLK
jgi:hypothetical protein